MPHSRSSFRCRKTTLASVFTNAIKTTKLRWARSSLSWAAHWDPWSKSHLSLTGAPRWSAISTLAKSCKTNLLKKRKKRQMRLLKPRHLAQWSLKMKINQCGRPYKPKRQCPTCSTSSLSRSTSKTEKVSPACKKALMRSSSSSDQRPKRKTLTL